MSDTFLIILFSGILYQVEIAGVVLGLKNA